jgi:hypothetical protein
MEETEKSSALKARTAFRLLETLECMIGCSPLSKELKMKRKISLLPKSEILKI